MSLDDIPSQIDPITDPEKAATVAKAMTRAASYWGLTPAEGAALTGVPFDTYEEMLEGRFQGELTADQVARASFIIGIYKALGAVYSDELAGQWLTNPNTGEIYDGQRPLDVMLEGGLAEMQMVRDHLEAVGQGM